MELIILILLTAAILGSTDKSEYQIKKEADKLPPFTKQEAIDYYYRELLKLKQWNVQNVVLMIIILMVYVLYALNVVIIQNKTI